MCFLIHRMKSQQTVRGTYCVIHPPPFPLSLLPFLPSPSLSSFSLLAFLLQPHFFPELDCMLQQTEVLIVTQDVESSTSSDSSGSYCCPICGLPTRILWVACDSCDRWFHAECTDIDPDNFCNLHNVDWVCNDCV